MTLQVHHPDKHISTSYYQPVDPSTGFFMHITRHYKHTLQQAVINKPENC